MANKLSKDGYDILFKNDEDKIKAFDKIAERYYLGNFGSISKNELDTLMFSIYLDRLIDTNKNSDGTINYATISDYKLSKTLGITQQKVRSLKIKKQLMEPIEFDWQSALKQLTQNARLEDSNRKIVLSIPDPNLYYEIENFIDEKGAFVEKTLNRKELKLRIEYYIALLSELEPEENKKAIIKSIKATVTCDKKEQHLFDEQNIGKSLLNFTANTATIVSSIASLSNPVSIVWKSLDELIKRFQ